jgi:predicted alpha/beta superfamily hydrolase
MKRRIYVLPILLVLCPLFSLSAQDMHYAKKHVIQSKILNEERTYWINLPAAYDDPNFGAEKYPVIYVLDGKSNFFPIAGLVDFMSGRESVNFQIPEAIVVGIDTSDRMRVLTPTAIPTPKKP